MFAPALLRQLDLARFSGISLRLSRGLLIIEVARDDIEYVVRQIAHEAAMAKGVEIHAVAVTFEPDSTSSLRFRALVTARKILFTAHLQIVGRFLINDLLEAVLTDLRATGEGMMGDLAALAVQPELEKYADRPIPLALPVGFPLRLSDVRLEAGPPLQIIATVSQR